MNLTTSLQVHFPYLAFVLPALMYAVALARPLTDGKLGRCLLAIATLLGFGIPMAWLGTGFIAVLSNSGSLSLSPSNLSGDFWPNFGVFLTILGLHAAFAWLIIRAFAHFERGEQPCVH